ncbi:hypothetical protein ACOSP7_001452 [Xanthoceras sorbifolium]
MQVCCEKKRWRGKGIEEKLFVCLVVHHTEKEKKKKNRQSFLLGKWHVWYLNTATYIYFLKAWIYHKTHLLHLSLIPRFGFPLHSLLLKLGYTIKQTCNNDTTSFFIEYYGD